ncbi:MAG: PQQ-like beta-propeller repeat protein [Verrucomicrobia bacterium]|nr:PQQ-like beta-propeller repeat protein [Verrucomicrobiota bacterium]
MDATVATQPAKSPPRIRWWPACVIAFAAVAAIVCVRLQGDWPFQKRNLWTGQMVIIACGLLLVWWTFLSRVPKRVRLPVTLGVLAMLIAMVATFRIRGVSGDLIPILEPRWAKRELPAVAARPLPPSVASGFTDFPQFLGPGRNAVLAGPKLDPDWAAHPPEILWKQKIGAAWSGFSVAGGRAFTQEQRGAEECVSCYDLATGRLLWLHADAARYFTAIGGEGPRATPALSGGRVFTLGATGLLNCLDATTGKLLWSRSLVSDAQTTMPGWGFASSPLVLEDKVIVCAGGSMRKSLLAYRVTDGEPAWGAGAAEIGYTSPVVTTLAGVRQIVVFNQMELTAHDAATGAVLWEYPWGNGGSEQHVAVPVTVGPDRFVVSAGYGAGAELLELAAKPNGRLAPRSVWKSKRLKAKFANFVASDGFLYGLDDGILACVDLKDGAQRWKEGRYGHGQGLLVGENYLLMSEPGELILLRPTSAAPNELARFRVFNAKTWNPIALSGDRLLVRNDQEAACVRLKVAK